MFAAIDDADLVARIGMGSDPEAENELCRRMAPRIRLYGLRHLRDAPSADDLMQQVLIRTIETLRENKLRDPSKLASFMLGTARMTVIEWRRSTQRKARLLSEFGAHLTPPPPPEPRLDREQLARCVQSLKERERAAVVLCFYDESAPQEAADFLQVSQANLRVIRHRALHQLRGCMGVAA